METKLTISIVNWNSDEEMIKCIRKIQGSFRENNNYSIVIVYNSDDTSFNKLDLKSKIRISRITNKLNYGYAHAHNQVIVSTKSDYILLLNPDCDIDCKTIDGLLKILENDQTIGIIGTKIIDSNNKILIPVCNYPTLTSEFKRMMHDHCPPFGSKLLKKPKNEKYQKNIKDNYILNNNEAVAGPFLLIRRKMIEDIGLLEQKFFLFSEEYDLCKRAEKRKWKMAFSPHFELKHFLGQSRKKAPIGLSIYHQHRSRLLFFEKHYGKMHRNILMFIYSFFSIYSIIYCHLKKIAHRFRILSNFGIVNIEEPKYIFFSVRDLFFDDITTFNINEKF